MSDYKRLISYLYLYEDGVKLKNVGYVKVDVREGNLRLDVRMKANVQPRQAYLFLRDGDAPAGIEIGSMAPGNAGHQMKIVTDEADVMGSGVNFADCGGLIITCAGNLACAAGWDGLPVNPMELREYRMPEPEEAPQEVAESKAEAEEAVRETAGSEAETEEIPQEVTEVQTEAAEALQKNTESQNEEIDAPSHVEMTSIEGTPVKAFSDDGIHDCLRVTLEELAALPEKERLLGGNSFLRHGYYNYDHLIIGKKQKDDGEVRILGVPGVFYEQEKVMAEMFGFPFFTPAEEGQVRESTFGYWYREIGVD